MAERVLNVLFLDVPATRMPNNRISVLVNLPFASLDKLTLRKRLDEIDERKPDGPA